MVRFVLDTFTSVSFSWRNQVFQSVFGPWLWSLGSFIFGNRHCLKQGPPCLVTVQSAAPSDERAPPRSKFRRLSALWVFGALALFFLNMTAAVQGTVTAVSAISPDSHEHPEQSSAAKAASAQLAKQHNQQEQQKQRRRPFQSFFAALNCCQQHLFPFSKIRRKNRKDSAESQLTGTSNSHDKTSVSPGHCAVPHRATHPEQVDDDEYYDDDDEKAVFVHQIMGYSRDSDLSDVEVFYFDAMDGEHSDHYYFDAMLDGDLSVVKHVADTRGGASFFSQHQHRQPSSSSSLSSTGASLRQQQEQPQQGRSSSFSQHAASVVKQQHQQGRTLERTSSSQSTSSRSTPRRLLPPPPPPEELPLRFLRAGKGDPVLGMKRYEATLAWRKQFRIDTILREASPNFALIKRNYLHFYHLRGKNNEPVFYEKPPQSNIKLLREQGVDMDQLLRHYTQVTEFQWQYLERNDLARSIYVMDLQGIRLGDFVGDVVDMAKKATEFSGQHYPERAGYVFIINVPAWFKLIWNVVKPWIDESTLEKIKILRGKEEIFQHLSERIDPENIPPEYGGRSVPLGKSPEERLLADMVAHNNHAVAKSGAESNGGFPEVLQYSCGRPQCRFCAFVPARSY